MASPTLKILKTYSRDPEVVTAAGIAIMSTIQTMGKVIPFYPKDRPGIPWVSEVDEFKDMMWACN